MRGSKAFTGHPLCYCSCLPDSTCDFCSGLRRGTIDDYKQLVGCRVYYTGDMANIDGFGVVSRVTWDEKWGYGAEIDIRMEDGRKWKAVHVSSFQGIGRRFMTAAERQRQREEGLARLRANLQSAGGAR